MFANFIGSSQSLRKSLDNFLNMDNSRIGEFRLNQKPILEDCSIHEIIPGLFLSGYSVPGRIYELDSNKSYSNDYKNFNSFEEILNFRETIDTIIQAGPSTNFMIEDLFEDLDFNKEDFKTPELVILPPTFAPQELFKIILENKNKYLKNILKKIHNDLQNNKKVLVHCEGGIHRSATLIAAYLIARWKLSPDKVQACMGYIRPGTNIDRNFVNKKYSNKFLKEVEDYLLSLKL